VRPRAEVDATPALETGRSATQVAVASGESPRPDGVAAPASDGPLGVDAISLGEIATERDAEDDSSPTLDFSGAGRQSEGGGLPALDDPAGSMPQTDDEPTPIEQVAARPPKPSPPGPDWPPDDASASGEQTDLSRSGEQPTTGRIVLGPLASDLQSALTPAPLRRSGASSSAPPPDSAETGVETHEPPTNTGEQPEPSQVRESPQPGAVGRPRPERRDRFARRQATSADEQEAYVEAAARDAVAAALEESYQQYEARVERAKAMDDERERRRSSPPPSTKNVRLRRRRTGSILLRGISGRPGAATDVPEPSVPRPPSQGRIATVFDAIELTQRLRNRRANGYLHLDSGPSLVFIDGAPCSIHGLQATAALLDQLTDRGLLSPLTSSAVRSELLPDRAEVLLQRLAEEGMADPTTAWATFERILEHGLGALLNHVGEWTFQEERRAFIDLGGNQLPGKDIRTRLMTLLPRSVPLPRLLEALGGPDVRIRVAQWPADLARSQHAGFLGMLDGRTTFEDAERGSGLPREETASLAVLLLALGYGVREGYAPVQGRGFESAWQPWTIDTPPFPDGARRQQTRSRHSEPPMSPPELAPPPPEPPHQPEMPVAPHREPPPLPPMPPMPPVTAWPQAAPQPPPWPAPSMWPQPPAYPQPSAYAPPVYAPPPAPAYAPPPGWPGYPQPTYMPAPMWPPAMPYGGPSGMWTPPGYMPWPGYAPQPPPQTMWSRYSMPPPEPQQPTGAWAPPQPTGAWAPQPSYDAPPPVPDRPRPSFEAPPPGPPSVAPAAPIVDADVGPALQALRRRINSADYFEMLGVAPSAEITEIESAHATLTTPLKAAKFHDQKDVSALANEVCDALDEALAVLRVPELRDAYRRNLTRT